MADIIEIDGARALALLREVVAEGGEDFVYTPVPVVDGDGNTRERCRYVHDGCPSCGVGKALHKAGVPLEMLSSIEGERAHTLMYRDGGVQVHLTALASRVLDEFQTEQDGRTPWGTALHIATLEFAPGHADGEA